MGWKGNPLGKSLSRIRAAAARRRRWKIAAASILIVVAVASLAALAAPKVMQEPIKVVTNYMEMNGRQVPLPEGEWIVAGNGYNRVVAGVAGAFGTIDNTVLLNVHADRIRGMIEINTNSIPVTEGWGTTEICAGDDALARFNLYRTAIDGLCYFVDVTALASTAETVVEPAAWKSAQAYAGKNGLIVPKTWLTVGYRVSNRHNIVDARYHFDGLELNGLAPGHTEWSAEAVADDPEKTTVVKHLNAWAALLAELFETGLRGRLPERLLANAVPSPLVAKPTSAFVTEGIGRASKEARNRTLDRLVRDGVIAEKDLAAYQAAVEETVQPQTIEDYYESLLKKTASFNLFRVSVDYLLAFIVTTNAAVSGYITASIVVTHSIAQVFNDMAWDDYISGQKRDGSELVEFLYIGQPRKPAP